MTIKDSIMTVLNAIDEYDLNPTHYTGEQVLVAARSLRDTLDASGYLVVPKKLMDTVWSALTHYSYPSTYNAPRIGGPLEIPTAKNLTEWAVHALREIRKEISPIVLTNPPDMSPKFTLAHEARQKFEAYMHAKQPNPLLMERNVPSGVYKGYEVQVEWTVWKACAEVAVPDSYFHPTN